MTMQAGFSDTWRNIRKIVQQRIRKCTKRTWVLGSIMLMIYWRT